MAGRAPIKVYKYDLSGKYLETYDNIADFRRQHFPNDVGVRPMFTKQVRNTKYMIIGDTIALLERPGREMIKFIIAVHNSDFCKASDNTDTRAVEVYNLLGEKIAEVKNKRLAGRLFCVPYNTIVSQILSTKKKSLNKTGLYFKYKEDE